jgi:hypothetical protein
MRVLSGIVMLPPAPDRGVVLLGEIIQRRMEWEPLNAAGIRRQLGELGEARERGKVSAAEEKQAQKQLFATRVKAGIPQTPPPEER